MSNPARRMGRQGATLVTRVESSISSIAPRVSTHAGKQGADKLQRPTRVCLHPARTKIRAARGPQSRPRRERRGRGSGNHQRSAVVPRLREAASAREACGGLREASASLLDSIACLPGCGRRARGNRVVTTTRAPTWLADVHRDSSVASTLRAEGSFRNDIRRVSTRCGVEGSCRTSLSEGDRG